MRRGMESTDDLYGNDPSKGWTKTVLIEASGLSTKTFDTIRKAARVKGPSHGGRNWVFTPEDLFLMIRKAEGGTFTERGKPAAEAWRVLVAERGVDLPEELKRKEGGGRKPKA